MSSVKKFPTGGIPRRNIFVKKSGGGHQVKLNLNPPPKMGPGKKTKLMEAAFQGDLALAQREINSGADVN